jgi:hypothetical protein
MFASVPAPVWAAVAVVAPLVVLLLLSLRGTTVETLETTATVTGKYIRTIPGSVTTHWMGDMYFCPAYDCPMLRLQLAGEEEEHECAMDGQDPGYDDFRVGERVYVTYHKDGWGFLSIQRVEKL